MKIIDCFSLFNELDLLEFRLKLLDPVVSHFVISESDHTHSGTSKPWFFEMHKDRFRPWLHKILYLPIRQRTEGLVFEKDLASFNPENGAWKLENEQRNALSAARPLAEDEDLVMVSDLDEIPDPRIIKQIISPEEPMSLSMLFHYYFMNCQNTGKERWWTGTVLCSGKKFKEFTPQQLRLQKDNFPKIKKAGWHFSYLGGLEKIKDKIRSFAHTELSKEEFLSDKNILTSLRKGRDIFKRGGFHYKFASIYYYPGFLQRAMLEYPGFLQLKGNNTALQKLYYSAKHRFS